MSDYSTNTKFIDLKAQQNLIRTDIEKAIYRVLDHGHYIMGPEVIELEKELAKFADVEHVVTCGNGTDALSLVLMAWGVGAGDVVFVPSFTYVASAETVAQLGATPYFVDVCPTTFNIDPTSLEQAINDCHDIAFNPAAVIAVDLFGQIAEMQAISELCEKHNLKLLVDGAQSFGAVKDGKKVGGFGDATTTSFFPAKPLGCYGDGGAILTNDKVLAARVDSLRLHGRGGEKYEHVNIGVNSRLDTLQAAVLLEKLKIFPDEIRKRNLVAQAYSREIKNNSIILPQVGESNLSVWAQYTLCVPNHRDEFQLYMKKEGVPTAVYYPKPLHLQAAFETFPRVSGGLPVSEYLSQAVISIPMHPYISSESIRRVIVTINSFRVKTETAHLR